MTEPTLETLVDRGDVDGLLRLLDDLAADGAWSEIARMRAACRGAAERGRQLWPVVSHADYRLALEAPPDEAAAVIGEGAGHFALGPLTEVIATTHTWADLAPHLGPGPQRSAVAAERVLRGDTVDVDLADLPDRIQTWEPVYPLAQYRRYEADFPPPAPLALQPVDLPGPTATIVDAGAAALRDLVTPWTDQSNGRVDIAAVQGGALDAVVALGVPAIRARRIDPARALAEMAWAAASGGAHGRRRGMALGRWEAWWCASRLAGFDEWPVHPDELGQALTELEWWLWDAYEPPIGWRLQLAAADPSHHLAWAIAASDAD